jgi:tyrosine-protein kinase Etk/Wzc
MASQEKLEARRLIEDRQDSVYETEKKHFIEPLIVMAKHKVLILGTVVGAALLSLVVVFLLPQYFTAEAKLLPPQQSQSMASAMMGQLSQLAPLLQAAGGKDLGIHNPNDMYVAMLKSRTVADALIDRFSLMNVYHKKLREEARRRLEDLTQIAAGKDGIISVSVDDRSPSRAADIANAYIDELEKLTRTLAVTDAGKRRIFFEREVKAANDELATAESQLKQTEESTGIIQLDSQAKVMLQAYADLRAQVAEKQVEIQSMRSFATPENPDLIRVQQELAALRTQLSRFERGQGNRSPTDLALEKVPGAGLEYVRKLREVKYRETLFELLAKQYEAARIDEARDASVIQVMDKAITPEKRSWPKRGLFVLAVTLLALLVGILLAYLTEGFKRTKEDPQFAAKWHLLKAYLWSGSKL